jgi:predicted alpha/beta superfamily hydrolase
MPTSRRRIILRVAGWLVAILSVAYFGLLAAIWTNRVDLTVRSAALGEPRKITIFGGASTRQSNRKHIYSLDGDKARHGLLPAAHGAIVAWLHGDDMPMLIAVHDQGKRDVDFRPDQVSPADWRPNIKGRGPLFDHFLLEELRSTIERRFGKPQQRFLFGHSLGGFYAIDMPSRQRDHGFQRLYAFSPTFSHDVSLIERLGDACANSQNIYANIGLESNRDTAMFDRAEAVLISNPRCRGKFTLSRHFAIVHQLIMLTGQISALWQVHATAAVEQ